MGIVTLTTDFGTRDWFVGTMKGVIAGLASGARVIDITHGIPPGDIRGGAFALAAAAPHFPVGTTHVAVIDPGVGSERKAIALRTKKAIFVGPDNGVLPWAVRMDDIEEIRVLSNTGWFKKPVSQTFHGRDIFSPVAARLASGANFSDAGEAVTDFVRLDWPEPEIGDRSIVGEIIYVDQFGNAITNIPAEALASGSEVTVRCGTVTAAVKGCYAGVEPVAALAIVGSGGYLELAVNGGSFSDVHEAGLENKVEAAW